MGEAVFRERDGSFVNGSGAVAKRGWRGMPLPLRNVLIVLTVGVLLARIGPFGTFTDLTPGERFAYWIGLTLMMWVQTAVALHVLRMVPALAARPWWGLAIIAGLIGAVPTTFEVAWVEGVLRLGGVLTPLSMLKTYGDVALFAVGLAVPLEAIRGHVLFPVTEPGRPSAPYGEDTSTAAPPFPADAEPPGPAGTGPDRLLQKLPPRLGRDILAVAAEDHYLRVHTPLGSDLILYRFGDALADLADADGLRVHRSWWVARAAVAACRREGERTVLDLSNGLTVPVSRTYLLALRTAGIAPAEG